MSRVLYFDCLAGISGDMTLAALVDLGADIQEIEKAIRSMGLPDVSLTTREVKKKGFRAIKLDVGHPPEHAHRHLHTIEEMIDRGDSVEPAAKDLAKKIFRVVAEAEAKVHGSTLQKVHFHEVGAIDSIADIVGTAVAMTRLQITEVHASRIPTGTGKIKIAHGLVSVPAPATAEILRGIPLADCEVPFELTTPTGAAILKATANAFGPMPAMEIDRIGYGAGSLDLEDRANVLRVTMGRPVDGSGDVQADLEMDQVVLLETNLDDCTAEQLADACQRLLRSGALDVFQTPCTMKKGRAGVVLSVLCSGSNVPELETIMFQHTTSIGIRRSSMSRRKLKRKSVAVATSYGSVQGKVVELPGGTLRFKAEHDAAERIAGENNVSTLAVHQAAERAWFDSYAKSQD